VFGALGQEMAGTGDRPGNAFLFHLSPPREQGILGVIA
jgi:hypothetical protein